MKYGALPLGGGSGRNSSIDVSPFSLAPESCGSWENREIRKEYHQNSTSVVAEEFCCLFLKYIYKCQILSLLCCWQPVFALVPKTSCVHFRREKKDIRDWLLRTDILECVRVCANKKINLKKRKAIKRLSKSHWGEKKVDYFNYFHTSGTWMSRTITGWRKFTSHPSPPRNVTHLFNWLHPIKSRRTFNPEHIVKEQGGKTLTTFASGDGKHQHVVRRQPPSCAPTDPDAPPVPISSIH